jgi:RRXRR protein
MGMQYVFVVDAQRRPLMPCRPARARLLLKRGQAAVLRRYPFVIILKAAKPDAVVHRLRLKIDPGSQTTGLALMTTLPHTEVPPTATCEQTAFVHPTRIAQDSLAGCGLCGTQHSHEVAGVAEPRPAFDHGAAAATAADVLDERVWLPAYEGQRSRLRAGLQERRYRQGHRATRQTKGNPCRQGGGQSARSVHGSGHPGCAGSLLPAPSARRWVWVYPGSTCREAVPVSPMGSEYVPIRTWNQCRPRTIKSGPKHFQFPHSSGYVHRSRAVKLAHNETTVTRNKRAKAHNLWEWEYAGGQ